MWIEQKPDWTKAPTWANWLAQYKSGIWRWFQNKPELSKTGVGGWIANGESIIIGIGLPPDDYEDTLEQKPIDFKFKLNHEEFKTTSIRLDLSTDDIAIIHEAQEQGIHKLVMSPEYLCQLKRVVEKLYSKLV
ncbi:hypothetical protein CEQ07_03900 [Oligella urethralis]|uniref:hypothetical protein n=1 Tax=Oligella urethralis TaxID=90245 RepID=UPI000D002CE4|nr:hypothetical protein [Oligella urethralis]AVL70647.1 hypothetical protein CEQ07_03900 [Oligella urethralis]